MHAYFTSLSANTVITALVGENVIAVARDENQISMPLEVAVEAAAETLRLLLDDDRIRNHRAEDLFSYLFRMTRRNCCAS